MTLAKTLLKACIISALTLSATDAAPDDYFSNHYGVDLHFKVLKLPHFPHTLKGEGFLEGHVRVALDIDYTGELRDWLVLESSHPAFSESLERVIGDWRFSAPHIDGESKSIVTEIDIQFRSKGSVVSIYSGASLYNRRINEIFGFRSHYNKLSSISELDTPPFPIEQTPPKVPKELIKQYDGTRAVFTFYVDEAGQVRIPVLSQTDGDPDLNMVVAVQDAIAQWKFDPPTKNKRPVKIQLSQAFVFKE